MKLESKLFDRIRIRPRHEPKPEAAAIPTCAWEGCDEPGTYRAPKGHRAEGEYHNFCLEHVRHYNTAFNFFAGLDKDQLEEALYQPQPGQARPSFGVNGKTGAGPRVAPPKVSKAAKAKFGDPFGVFARYAYRQSKAPPRERITPLNEQDRRAFEALGLEGRAKSEDIKKSYKALVKIHHPDANGGDRSSEDRLRAIISAYGHLKLKGFVIR